MSVEYGGLDDVIESFESLLDKRDLEAALGKACALVERSAKQKAPKGSGELRRSIDSKIEGDTGIVFTPVYYAPYVEYGTGLFAEDGKGRKEVPWVYVEGGNSQGSSSKKVYTPDEAEAAAAFLESKGLDAVVTYGQHPHPFMRPALYENREEILRLLKDGITE